MALKNMFAIFLKWKN